VRKKRLWNVNENAALADGEKRKQAKADEARSLAPKSHEI
jgi:hypothetical protein